VLVLQLLHFLRITFRHQGVSHPFFGGPVYDMHHLPNDYSLVCNFDGLYPCPNCKKDFLLIHSRMAACIEVNHAPYFDEIQGKQVQKPMQDGAYISSPRTFLPAPIDKTSRVHKKIPYIPDVRMSPFQVKKYTSACTVTPMIDPFDPTYTRKDFLLSHVPDLKAPDFLASRSKRNCGYKAISIHSTMHPEALPRRQNFFPLARPMSDAEVQVYFIYFILVDLILFFYF
jgi:hypothetical protein